MGDSDRRSQAIVQQAAVGIVVADLGGRMLEVNAAFHRMLGYPEPELRGMTVDEVTHPEDRGVGLELYRELVAGERQAYEIEKRYLRRDGSIVWGRVNATAVRREDGSPELVIGVVEDVDARRRAEEALRDAEARYRTLVEELPLVTYIDALDERSSNIYTSPQLEPILGYATEEWQADPDLFVKALHPDDRERVLAEIAAANESGERFASEYRLVARDGRVVWFRDECVTVYDAGGKPRYSQGYLLDITERKSTEEALRESEERFRRMADDSPVLVWTTDPEGNVTFFSKAWLELVGHSFDEEIGAGWIQSVHPDDAPRAVTAYREAIRAGVPWEAEYRLLRPDGSYRWISDRGNPQFSADGELVGYVGVGIDVTERREAEEALAETTRKLESLVANAPLAIVTSDQDGNVTGWNPAAERMFGWTAEETLGRPPPHFAPGDPDGLESRARATAGEVVSDADAKRLRKDGSVIDVRYGKAPLRDAQGEIVGTMAMLTDVTERKRADAELRETTQTLEAIVDSSPLAIMTFDAEGRVTRWNEAAERTFGWTAGEAIGRFNPMLPEGEEEAFRKAVGAALRGKSWRSVEVRRKHRDGSDVDVSISSAPLRDAEGTPVGMVAVLVDVSERKRTDARLAAQHAVARVLASSAAIDDATPAVLDAVCDVLGWDLGVLWVVDREQEVLRPLVVRTRDASLEPFAQATFELAYARGTGLPGRVWEAGEPMWLAGVPSGPNWPRRELVRGAGIVSSVGAPVESGGELVGVLEFFSRAVRELDDDMLAMLTSIGRQLGQFLGRVQADASVREREKRFRTLVSNLPGAVYRCAADEHWTMEFMSEAIVDICGFPASDFVANRVRTYASVIHEQDRDEVTRAVDEAIARRSTFEIEYRVVHADGSVRWVSEMGQPMLGPGGQVAWLDGAIFDVTEARRARDELSRANAFLDSVVESLPTPLFLKDAAELRFVRVNRAAEEAWGIPRGELLGKNDLDFFPAEQAEFFMAIDRDVLERHELLDIPEEPIETREHGTRYLHTRKVPILGNDGCPEYVLGLSVDITEQKRATMERERLLAAEQAALEQAEAARAQLAAQNEALLELDRLKDEFVALVSHELRTPLTSILGYLELLIEGDAGEVTDDQAHFLAIVERNAQRLLRLVGDLLFVAQIEAGKLTIERHAVDLFALAVDCLEAARPRAAEKRIELQLEGGPVAGLVGDRVRLAQLLDNLVSNAIKFTPDGGRVRVRLAAQNSHVTLSVSDTGIGIPAEEQVHLFQRFFRSSSATAGAIQGTGLGLTITKAIAEAHGGAIAVESVEGQGTTFLVDLPLGAESPADSTPAIPEPMEIEGGSLR